MALNFWWIDRPEERFWMEITDREKLGDDLTAPQARENGDEYWSYSLVTATRPGDIVLHWHKNLAGEPAIVGWSIATGPLASGQMIWQARGTSARRSRPKTRPSWVMPCGGFNTLRHPVTREDLLSKSATIDKVKQRLEDEVGSTYFPFVFYRLNEIRAAQAYLTKFPAALIHAFPELNAITSPNEATSGKVNGRAKTRASTGAGRQSDARLRKAIERHAVDLAKEHYRQLGATSITELGAPYDLIVHGLGPVRHVEVKGSIQSSVAVELTVNEVTHARNYPHTDLVAVDQITWLQVSPGVYRTGDGNLRVWTDWMPNSDALAPTRYRYKIPENSNSL